MKVVTLLTCPSPLVCQQTTRRHLLSSLSPKTFWGWTTRPSASPALGFSPTLPPRCVQFVCALVIMKIHFPLASSFPSFYPLYHYFPFLSSFTISLIFPCLHVSLSPSSPLSSDTLTHSYSFLPLLIASLPLPTPSLSLI